MCSERQIENMHKTIKITKQNLFFFPDRMYKIERRDNQNGEKNGYFSDGINRQETSSTARKRGKPAIHKNIQRRVMLKS